MKTLHANFTVCLWNISNHISLLIDKNCAVTYISYYPWTQHLHRLYFTMIVMKS